MYSPLREKIINALSLEPRLTARQVARLIHPQSEGASLQNPDGYDKTNAMLNRMVEEKYLDKLARPAVTQEFMYSLRRSCKPLKWVTYDHERHAADVFVSFARTGLLEAWEYYPRPFNGSRLLPDRGAKLAGIRQHIYVEIDQGTEPLRKIEGKVRKYINASGGQFQVLFIAPTEGRADNILEILEHYEKGNQFLVTIHKFVTAYPTGSIFATPVDIKKPYSLAELQQ